MHDFVDLEEFHISPGIVVISPGVLKIFFCFYRKLYYLVSVIFILLESGNTQVKKQIHFNNVFIWF